MDAFFGAFPYVVNAPYFWISAGMTVSVAMFVGAIIFDGKLPMVTKGIIAVGMYAFFLVQINITRIVHMFDIGSIPIERQIMAFGGIVTILIVTVLWCLGMLLGVSVCRWTRKHYRGVAE